jgi:hypothetical protein
MGYSGGHSKDQKTDGIAYSKDVSDRKDGSIGNWTRLFMTHSGKEFV